MITRSWLATGIMAVALAAPVGAVVPVASVPAVGFPAPDFSLRDQHGKTVRLKDFKSKQAVVLAWFVKAGTGG